MHVLRPRPLPSVLFVGLVPVAAWFILRPLLDPIPSIPALYSSVGFSIFAFLATIYLVPALGPTFINARLFGRDLLKYYDKSIPEEDIRVPESMGLVAASVYILSLILFIPFAFSISIMEHGQASKKNALEGITVVDFPHYQLAVYLSSLLSLLVATMLGFLDDVFDIRWRHKLPIPIIASIPLLMVYYAERGNTNVVVPLPLRFLFGSLINLGPLYYIYMSLLSTFSTNSINILAGINGSEVSQALIIALSVILNDILYLPWPVGFRLPLYLLGNKTELDFGGVWHAGMAYGSRELVERHLFSLYFMLPLVAVCTGFLYHNWYPARAFPGDTLCYLTGMAFSVVGIQAHFSKTLLLFFMPQIFNFVLSCPQLFGLVPCPRHRVPRFDKDTNLLHPSLAVPATETNPKKQFPAKTRKLTKLALGILETLGLTKVTRDAATGEVTNCTNLTILNVFLLWLGPMNEKRLVQVLISSQIAGSALAFFIRYGLAWLVFDGDRR